MTTLSTPSALVWWTHGGQLQTTPYGLYTFCAKMVIGAWFEVPLLQDIDKVMEILEGRGNTTPESLHW
jgi:hypothetical protein